MFKKLYSKLAMKFAPKIIREIKNSDLSYLDPFALIDIYWTVFDIEKKGINGQFLEAGCALGGSAIVIAKAKEKNRYFYIYDVFDMIPPPSKKDDLDAHQRYELIKSGKAEGINKKTYYGYEKNLLSKVKSNFQNFGIDTKGQNIQFIVGLFQESLIIKDDVAFAHIDADWYNSVMICLERIEPYLVSGGVLIIDDYKDWSGCKRAVDEYFQNKSDEYLFIQKSRLHIIRK